MIKVYCYNKCSTCRKALQFLQDQKIEHEVLAIRETPPTAEEIRAMLEIYAGQWRRLFNTSGMDYRALGLADQLDGLDEMEKIRLLTTNGNLVKRPFLLGDGIGVVGFDPERWRELLVDGVR